MEKEQESITNAEEINKKDNTNATEEVVDQEDSQEENTSTEETKDGKAEADVEVDEIDRLKQELGESKDKYIRLYSEFENFRRRNAKERIELISTANKDLITELLPVLDDFERALQSFSEETDAKSIHEGVELIHNKFSKVLEAKGLKLMSIEKGDHFDTDVHEAVTQIPSPEDNLKGKNCRCNRKRLSPGR